LRGYFIAKISYARWSIIFVALTKLLIPMDSSVPCALLSIGSSSGWDPEKPYVVIPRGLVNLESVNPLLIAGTNCMSSLSKDFFVAV
jgi:hypothetical protein